MLPLRVVSALSSHLLLSSPVPISWVTLIWCMCGGACLMLALMHFVVWWKDRTARAKLVFSVMAIAAAAFAVLALALLRAATREQFGLALRWMYVLACVIIVLLV